MALNIKNERTVALIRELAEVTGQNMTSAVEEAIMAHLERVHAEADQRATAVAARLADIDAAVAALHASMTDEQRQALSRAEEDLYDDQGLPR